jgi:hypothetical protein
MVSRVECAEDACTECERIVLRVYCELRRAGYDDRRAFQSAMHVLELRHPGHERDYYRARADHMIAPERVA